MHSLLFVFEFLGTTELLVVAVVALILFGPRKLPEIGRTVGRGIAEFKRASDDFKRTWEYEVEIERRAPAPEVSAATHEFGAGAGAEAVSQDAADAAEPAGADAQPEMWGTPIARGSEEVFAGDGGDARTGDAQKRAREEDEINAS
ncbi:MAG TPA: twin-arginine translocase TatA/TatE family subunit [Pyrinomonadaceae bacterium]|jgi:TatA/E family protein of Tat protein translocase